MVLNKFINKLNKKLINKDVMRLFWGAVCLSSCLLCGCASGKQSYTAEGIAALSQQNYTLALQNFDQAMLAGENAEEVYRGMGLTYMGQGMYAKAVTAFQNALANAVMFPGELEYDINYYLAIAYYKLGEYELAIDVYDSIVALEPKAVDAYFLRGSMKLYLADAGEGELEDAMADFDLATSINKNDYGRYIDVYACMNEHGYTTQAQVYMDKVLVVDSGKISDYDKGRLSYFQGDYEQACNYLERARSNNSADSELIAFLGECYQKEGKYSYACAVYSGYVDENADPEIYNKMGLCYVEEGDYNNALISFQAGQQILENNTCMQTLKLNEIACYEYMHDFRSARDKLAEYLSVYPSTADLQREYAFLVTR